MAKIVSPAAKAALKAYRDRPVVIDGDDDKARIMHPDRQQGFLDALTELSRQWGIRIKDMQTSADVKLTAIDGGLYGREGHYALTGPPGKQRINWRRDDEDKEWGE